MDCCQGRWLMLLLGTVFFWHDSFVLVFFSFVVRVPDVYFFFFEGNDISFINDRTTYRILITKITDKPRNRFQPNIAVTATFS
jgi:hypothetical protein